MVVADLARAIAMFEGFFSGPSRARRNNNPGNLKYAGQPGAVGADRDGFAIFATVDDGWRALERQIRLDASRGHSLASFLSKYAPPSENPTSGYLAFVRQQLGLPVEDLHRPLANLFSRGQVAEPYIASVTTAMPWGLVALAVAAALLLWRSL